MVYDDDPTIPPLSVRTAANRLGMSNWAVHKAIDRGELRPVTRHPIQVSADDVEAMRVRKRDAAIEQIGVERMARVAADVRAQLHPPFESGAPREAAALELIPERLKAAFTMPLMHAAALPDDSGCRWCAAEIAGKMLAVPVRPAMLSSEAGVALLGSPKCERHRGLMAGRLRELAARVRPGGESPSAARTQPAASAGRAAVPKPAVRAAERARGDDDGRSMVQRRLRETRARQKAAKRAGDQAYALRLAKVVRGLEADAARLDGAVTASARPGRLRCGHLLAANCACPRRASKRATS